MILVIGGTKGIGLAIARWLAKPGVQFFLGYHSDDAAAATAKAEIESLGARATTIKRDVGTIGGCTSIMQQIDTAREEPLHIIHSAATVYPTGLLDADLEKLTRAIQTNGLSLLYLVQKALPKLSRGSSIVFISSAGSRHVGRGYGALGPAKALAESIMHYLVPELAPRGIRINAVAPGTVRTGSVAKMVGNAEAAEIALLRATQANPSGRLCRDSDYASVVEFLISPNAEFVQGQMIDANGGTS
ncbi:MAG: SDR family oxidoreductase [Rhizomicrobium sp.]